MSGSLPGAVHARDVAPPPRSRVQRGTEVDVDDVNGAWWAWLAAFGLVALIAWQFGFPFLGV